MLVFEAEDDEGEVCARAVAEVMWCDAWRGEADWRTAPSPSSLSAVFVAAESEKVRAALKGSGWEGATRHAVSQRVGHHECAGGFAAAAAVSLLARGELDMALVLGLAPVRTRALVLRAVGAKGRA